MDKATMDNVLFIVQVVLGIVQTLSLIALVLYVWKTWQIASANKQSAASANSALQEMKESREQETAPYVVAYFEIEDYEGGSVYFVVKNIGKSIATNVTLESDPSLSLSIPGMAKKLHPILTKGVNSILPNYAIRIYFINLREYFLSNSNGKRGIPSTYSVKITYHGGLNKEVKTSEQVLDLSMYEGFRYKYEHGTPELIRSIEELARSISGGVMQGPFGGDGLPTIAAGIRELSVRTSDTQKILEKIAERVERPKTPMAIGLNIQQITSAASGWEAIFADSNNPGKYSKQVIACWSLVGPEQNKAYHRVIGIRNTEQSGGGLWLVNDEARDFLGYNYPGCQRNWEEEAKVKSGQIQSKS